MKRSELLDLKDQFMREKVMKFSASCSLLIICIALSACMVGPDYKPPKVQVPEDYREVPDPALLRDKGKITSWWKVFNDPLLMELIKEASRDNLDLKTAVARVKEARAQVGVEKGELYPVVDADVQGTRERTSENLGGQGGITANQYDLGFDASWEIDLFGSIRRSVEAAEADLQASEEDRADVMISLYAEIATKYLTLRSLQAQITAAKRNIASQKEVLILTQKRLKYGLATALDTAQAESNLADSETTVPPLRIELVKAINSIGILLGRPPGALYDRLSKVEPIPVPPKSIAVGVPADLLRQRPDIRQAERELAAQTARIGVATADLYPSFSLTGSLGFQSISTGHLFDGSSLAYSFGPTLSWNLFNRDRIRSQIQVEDARTEQALLNYEQTILEALNEIENAMTSLVEQRVQYEAQLRSAKAARRTVKLATRLYKDGLADFQNVLDAQRSLLDIELQVAEAEGDTATNVVALYKALGGGWDPGEIDKGGKIK